MSAGPHAPIESGCPRSISCLDQCSNRTWSWHTRHTDSHQARSGPLTSPLRYHLPPQHRRRSDALFLEQPIHALARPASSYSTTSSVGNLSMGHHLHHQTTRPHMLIIHRWLGEMAGPYLRRTRAANHDSFVRRRRPSTQSRPRGSRSHPVRRAKSEGASE